MRSPFPGMDPYLEHPVLWPDVHNRLVTALADAMTPLVAPRYYLALERRTYTLAGDELVLIGRPDLAVVEREPAPLPPTPRAQPGMAVMEVTLPEIDEVSESYLEVHDVATGSLVTLVEVLSPWNKVHAAGRQDYLAKRIRVLHSLTNLIEVDLLRDGAPMPLAHPLPDTDYRILVSRSPARPLAELHVFGVRDPLPMLAVPLVPGEPEPRVDLGEVWQSLYSRARFDLRIDYQKESSPPLRAADREWARQRVATAGR
ncbi:MAG: DUF4058 family protein [Planctomycetota bacterium]